MNITYFLFLEFGYRNRSYQYLTVWTRPLSTSIFPLRACTRLQGQLLETYCLPQKTNTIKDKWENCVVTVGRCSHDGEKTLRVARNERRSHLSAWKLFPARHQFFLRYSRRRKLKILPSYNKNRAAGVENEHDMAQKVSEGKYDSRLIKHLGN